MQGAPAARDVLIRPGENGSGINEVRPSSPPTATTKSNFGPMMGNFSVQYNFTSASIAVEVLSDSGYLGHPLDAQPSWSKTITLPIVFFGAMIGMSFMGRMGDVLGRKRAMALTLILTIMGAIIPALAFGPAASTYGVVCFGRLILGIGVGGIYPLSAVSSAEGSSDSVNRGRRVGTAFFFQCIGQVCPYLVSMVLLGTMKPSPAASWVPEVQFRALFALGAVPAAVVLVTTLMQEEAPESVVAQQEDVPSLAATMAALPRQTWWTLLGTAGSWFLYDVAFYGTAIFTPQILKNICLMGTKDGDTCHQTLFETSYQSAMVTFMGIPACLLAIALVSKVGCKRINIVGFVMLALCFAALAITWTVAKDQDVLLFVLFCLLTFFLNFGPNLGTYVLPAICYPKEIRSTCHGASATGGKLGALLGALMFSPLSKGPIGIVGVMWIQAGICVLGAAISHSFLRHDWEYLSEDDKIATASFVHGVRHGESVRSSCAESLHSET